MERCFLEKLTISDSTIIYVVCGANYKTGGTELAHQLVAEINNNNRTAQIAYYGIKDGVDPIDPAFRKYVSDYVKFDDIIDANENVVVIPEIHTEYVNRFKRIQVCVWWMSVDNFRNTHDIAWSIKRFGMLKTLYHLINHKLIIQKKFNQSILHLYQSEYARRFLERKGYSNVQPLSDYLNETYFLEDNNQTLRQDIVLYNPSKGYEYTKKLIGQSMDLKWMPIQKMTTDEVANLLKNSKVYIDFGNHPGKDRFPREAAISGCCVIVGRNGSADNEVDVPIPEKYKFYTSDEEIPKILNCIMTCLDNYDESRKDFDEYRKIIRAEHECFINEVRLLIGK